MCLNELFVPNLVVDLIRAYLQPTKVPVANSFGWPLQELVVGWVWCGASKADPVVGINLLNKFLKLQPSNFRGTANPSELDEWMREPDKIFKTMICPEEYKAGLACIYSRMRRIVGGIRLSR